MRPRNAMKGLAVACLLVVVSPIPGPAADRAFVNSEILWNKRLIVGTKEAVPFAFKNDDGEWDGISIALWRRIATQLGLAYEFSEAGLGNLIEGVRSGEFDLALAALTISHDRETLIDFSHTYYATGLGIAVVAHDTSDWLATTTRIFSAAILAPVGILAAIVIGFGFVLWVLERKRNAKHFGGGAKKGIEAGIWWSAVTMTTVGYGDKVPVTTWGRALAVIWMFTSIVVISIFTATIATTLTVESLQPAIDGPEDLPNVRVGSVDSTTGAAYLSKQHVETLTFDDAGTGLEAVAEGDIDALVHDAPLLRYLIREDHHGSLAILAATVEPQHYGIAFPPRSRLREPVNRILLKEIRGDWWRDLLFAHLGENL